MERKPIGVGKPMSVVAWRLREAVVPIMLANEMGMKVSMETVNRAIDLMHNLDTLRTSMCGMRHTYINTSKSYDICCEARHQASIGATCGPPSSLSDGSPVRSLLYRKTVLPHEICDEIVKFV